MGQHLNRAKMHFGTDTRGLLEDGRYALRRAQISKHPQSARREPHTNWSATT
ncbi:MAG: hypothetical protein JOZ49_06445 [Mycolicibacterium sp.]|nr:hypothetical protein [Mycolicibacterium sp.]